MLAVGHSLTLGSLRYDSHLAGLTLRRGTFPIVDRMDARLPRGVHVDAGPGDPAVLELDGGDGSETVFTGTVTSVRRDLGAIVVVAHTASHALARYRPSLSLEQVTVGDVISRLSADVGAAPADIDDGPTLARYVALARYTALQEVTRLAQLAGAAAIVTGDGEVRASASAANERHLRWGREPLAVAAAAPASVDGAFVVAGEGAADPGQSRGLWPTDDFWAGGAPLPGPEARLRVDHDIRSTDDAKAAGEAWAARAREPGHLSGFDAGCCLRSGRTTPSTSPRGRATSASAPSGSAR